MNSILILYSTVDGHTREICLRLKQVIERQGHRVALHSLDEEPNIDLKPFDKIVIGASIRYGKHRPQLIDFIERHAQILESKPGAFFSVSGIARKPEKNRTETNPYLRKFLENTTWKPRHLAVFAGKSRYPGHSRFVRKIIRLIEFFTSGTADGEKFVEFTDWQQVEAFGQLICEDLSL